MQSISIKREYINIVDSSGRQVSIGGNQTMFSDSSWCNISGQGCGLISAVDLFLYMNGCQRVDLNTYESLLSDFMHINIFTGLCLHEFFLGRLAIGVVPWQICRFINRKSKGRLKAKYKGMHGHRNMLALIKEQIADDIPVIWALYRFNKRICLYTYDDKSRAYTPGVYTNSHYVNAISIEENPSDKCHKTMIKVSSWGRIYYVDYDEYLSYVRGSLISKYCSNIFFIEKSFSE